MLFESLSCEISKGENTLFREVITCYADFEGFAIARLSLLSTCVTRVRETPRYRAGAARVLTSPESSRLGSNGPAASDHVSALLRTIQPGVGPKLIST